MCDHLPRIKPSSMLWSYFVCYASFKLLHSSINLDSADQLSILIPDPFALFYMFLLNPWNKERVKFYYAWTI